MLLGGKATERSPSLGWLPARQVQDRRKAIANYLPRLFARAQGGRQQMRRTRSEGRLRKEKLEFLCVTQHRGAQGPGILPGWLLTLMAIKEI